MDRKERWFDGYLLQLLVSTHRCSMTTWLLLGCALGMTLSVTFCQKKSGRTLVQAICNDVETNKKNISHYTA